MVASKGFCVSKIEQKKAKQQELQRGDFKIIITNTFDAIKNKKNLTLDLLNSS